MTDAWTEAMLDGDFPRAWRISDRVLRRRRDSSCAHLPHHLRWVWDGTPLAGRRVLVRCYHGLGDTLQFIRFVSRVAGLAEKVVVEAQPALLPLLASVAGAASVHELGSPLPPTDVEIESMELPHALRLTVGDLPGPVPYLQTPPLPPRLRKNAGRPRVGLVWAGGDWRRERSLPPHLLSPLLRLPVDFVSLQFGPARGAAPVPPLAAAYCAGLAENAQVTDTAALIAELDLVISIDTMVAHLAGALGRPVWTLLDAQADWRWMRDRADTPWYPTMRLFRQTSLGGWESVIAEVAALLESLASTSGGTTPQRLRSAVGIAHNGDHDGDGQDGRGPCHDRSR